MPISFFLLVRNTFVAYQMKKTSQDKGNHLDNNVNIFFISGSQNLESTRINDILKIKQYQYGKCQGDDQREVVLKAIFEI